MERRELTENIVEYFAKIREEKGRLEMTSIKDVCNHFPEEDKEVVSLCLDELYGLDFLKVPAYGLYQITEIGMAYVHKNDPLYAHVRRDMKNISVHASNSIVAVDGSEISIDLAPDFLSKFEKMIQESSELPESDKKTWLNRLNELSRHPILIPILDGVLKYIQK